MKRILFIAACISILSGCAKHSVLVDYAYDRLSPLMYEFTNYSHGCDSYKWDFGDGTFSLAPNVAYKEFDAPGTYTVTLTGYADGIRYEHAQTIRVTVPACYFAGFTLYHIPYENRYYKCVFKDDNLLPSSWDFQSTYTPMLSGSDLPYTVRFSSPRLLENIDSHDHYTIQVVRTTNASTTDGDTQCLKQQLKVKDIKTYQPEYVLSTSTDVTTVGILMEYVY